MECPGLRIHRTIAAPIGNIQEVLGSVRSRPGQTTHRPAPIATGSPTATIAALIRYLAARRSELELAARTTELEVATPTTERVPEQPEYHLHFDPEVVVTPWRKKCEVCSQEAFLACGDCAGGRSNLCQFFTNRTK